MTDFSVNFKPLVVPTLSTAKADDLAKFQANFAGSIVDTGNSLLQSFIAQKDTNFFAVGDIPVLGTQLTIMDPDLLATAKSRPAANTIDFTALLAKIDQLAALVAPIPPALATASADVSTLDAVAPVIVMPTPPSTDVGAPPGGAPSLEAVATPDAPLVTLPNVPTFDELQLPSAPSSVIPDWVAVAPQNLLAPPTAAFAYVDPGYVSQLHDPLVAKLLSDLTLGTYGIEPADESALWTRARDRAAQQGRAKAEEAYRRMASTSFPLPQAVLFDNLQHEEQQINEKLSETNRDIVLRRSELYVEGRKFTIMQVKEYEQIRINLYNATQERALNYAKAVVETGIAIYDASVKNYQAQLEGYKTEAQVFETRIRGELLKAELFRAQIMGESLRIEANKAKVGLYTAQLQGVQTVVDLYKSRIGAATLFMQLQSQRVDLFRAQVQAYAERVHAKEAEYNIYRAQIQGQLASVDVYKAQIDAYNAKLSGSELKARMVLQSNESLTQQYRAAVQQYSAQLESFGKQIQAKLDEARVRGVLYATDIDAYRAFVSAAMESARVQTDLTRFNFDWNKATLDARVNQVAFRLKQLGLTVDLQKDVNKFGMEFLRAALGGATSGLNALGVSSTTT
jgi:hypothetical protein